MHVGSEGMAAICKLPIVVRVVLALLVRQLTCKLCEEQSSRRQQFHRHNAGVLREEAGRNSLNISENTWYCVCGRELYETGCIPPTIPILLRRVANRGGSRSQQSK